MGGGRFRNLRLWLLTKEDSPLYFPARRNSFGVASHTNSPIGGDSRFNSTNATPTFFNEVRCFFEPSAVAMRSSSYGACPRRNTADACFCLASTRKRYECE